MEGLPTLKDLEPCRPHCTCKKHIKTIPPDNALVAWEKSQKETKKIRDRLAIKTSRCSDHLLMNTLEHHRALQQHRRLLTYAQVPCTFDRYRGNPAFWRMPPQLYKICDEPQQYFAQMSNLEKNEVPALEYVAVPKESNFTCLPSKSVSKSESFSLKHLDSCILNKLQPHKPDLDGVLIKGIALRRPQPQDIDDIFEFFNDKSSISLLIRDNVESTPEQHSTHQTKQSCFLILNDQRVMSDAVGFIKTNVLFNAGCNHSTQMHYLFVENKCTWSIRISFDETVKKPMFSSLRKTQTDVTRFFFNRNYQILQPNQKCNIPFWFKSSTCGYYDQLLQMSVVPDLWKGKLIIQVMLKASATDKDNYSKCFEYELMIQERLRNRLIQTCLNDILKNVPPEPSTIKIFTYDKASIFEALNSSFDPIHNRCKYLYSKKIVDELEAFYESVRLPQHPEIWSLSVNDLRTVTKDRETYEMANSLEENYEVILAKVEENREARRKAVEKLQKMFWSTPIRKLGDLVRSKPGTPRSPKFPRSAKSSPSKTKSKAIIEPIRTPKPETLTDHLEQLIAKLQSPITIRNEQSERLKICYNLFCSYIDKICTDIKEMSLNFFAIRHDPREVFKMNFDRARFINENLWSCDIELPQFSELVTNKGMQPQPAWALEIPLRDYEARYKASVSPKDKKDAKGRKSPPKNSPRLTSKKSDILSIKGKSRRTSRQGSESDFTTKQPSDGNPSEVHVTEEIKQLSFFIPEEKLDHYKNNIYMLFYTNLCDFVSDLEATFDVLPKPELPLEILQRINLSQRNRITQDPNLTVEVVNVRQRVSDILKWNIEEERVELPSASMRPPQKVGFPPDILRKSSSVWDIMKAYYPAKHRSEPAKEGDVYAKPVGKAALMVEGSTEITPEEIVTERQVQTSLCSEVSVYFGESTSKSEDKLSVCVCEKVDRDPCDQVKRVSSLYDSECCLSSNETDGTRDTDSTTISID